MIKKYICPGYYDYTFGLNVNGKRRFINFEPQQSGRQKVATFTTKDEDVMEAIESLPEYGTKITLFYKIEEESAVSEEVTPAEDGSIVVPVKIVNHFQKAKKYLIQNGYATSTEVTTKEAVLAIAEANKISFPGWNKDSITA